MAGIDMKHLNGKSVYKGVALGKVLVLKKEAYIVKRVKVENPDEEVKRVEAARQKSQKQLQKLYEKAVKEVGEASAAIFEVHQMMLEDDDYNESIENIIRTQEAVSYTHLNSLRRKFTFQCGIQSGTSRKYRYVYRIHWIGILLLYDYYRLVLLW